MLDANALYEPMLVRDAEETRATVSHHVSRHGAQAVMSAIVRFAVLAFTPSEHGKAALLSAAAASAILARVERAGDLIAECAIYSAGTRAPWSEPPVSDPPPLDRDQDDSIETIRAAIDSRDRLGAERWLAKLLERENVAERFFDAAALTLARGESGVITAVAAWEIASQAPPRARFPILRVAVDEWTSNSDEEERIDVPTEEGDEHVLLYRVAATYLAQQGTPLAFRKVALFSALHAMAKMKAGAAARRSVATYLFATTSAGDVPAAGVSPEQPPIYPLARDYGAALRAFAARESLRGKYDEAFLAAICATALKNLDSSESYEEWALA